jgi:type III secretion protein V
VGALLALATTRVTPTIADALYALHLALCASALVIAVRAGTHERRELSWWVIASIAARIVLEVAAARMLVVGAATASLVRVVAPAATPLQVTAAGVALMVLLAAQVVVIAKGTERAAEVAARFALDAVPGQQLAIDAELRAGSIDVVEARARRNALAEDGAQRAALDGAARLARGDALAGAGFVVVDLLAAPLGFAAQGAVWVDALTQGAARAIGHALTTRTPATFVSVAIAVALMRPAEGRSTVARAEGAAIAATLLLGVALVPGVAARSYVALAVVALGLSWWARATQAVEPSRVEVCIDGDARTANEARGALRATLDGLGLSHVGVRTTGRAGPIRVHVGDAITLEALSHEAMVRAVRGCVWRLVDLDMARDIVARAALQAPTAAAAVLRDPGHLVGLTAVLRALVREGVAITSVQTIIDTLARLPAAFGEVERVARVREALASQISRAHALDGVVSAVALDPMLEDALRDHVSRHGAARPGAALSRDLAAAVIAVTRGDAEPIVVTEGSARSALRAALELELPGVVVIAHEELDGVQLKIRAVAGDRVT